MSSSRTLTPAAAVITIGTEITSGQILNRNSQWISTRLTQLGFSVDLHLSVPDERQAMLDAFDHAARHCELLVLSGGLGPTTDDLTRQIVADWTHAPLQWREASWEKIVRRLKERGIPVAESNRQQCWFPQGSVILENEVGTADAFRFSVSRPDGKTLHGIVLPGPPRELGHLWEKDVDRDLRALFPENRPETLLTWRTLGVSESLLGEVVESAVSGLTVKTGYRASAPYVEVKIWVPYESPELETVRARVESAVGQWTLTRNQEDLAQLFLARAASRTGTLGITFLDLGSSGQLTERLLTSLKGKDWEALRDRIEFMTRFHEASASAHLPEQASEWMFALFPDGKAAVLSPEGKKELQIPTPYQTPALRERLNHFRSESAIRFFLESLAL